MLIIFVLFFWTFVTVNAITGGTSVVDIDEPVKTHFVTTISFNHHYKDQTSTFIAENVLLTSRPPDKINEAISSIEIDLSFLCGKGFKEFLSDKMEIDIQTEEALILIRLTDFSVTDIAGNDSALPFASMINRPVANIVTLKYYGFSSTISAKPELSFADVSWAPQENCKHIPLHNGPFGDTFCFQVSNGFHPEPRDVGALMVLTNTDGTERICGTMISVSSSATGAEKNYFWATILSAFIGYIRSFIGGKMDSEALRIRDSDPIETRFLVRINFNDEPLDQICCFVAQDVCLTSRSPDKIKDPILSIELEFSSLGGKDMNITSNIAIEVHGALFLIRLTGDSRDIGNLLPSEAIRKPMQYWEAKLLKYYSFNTIAAKNSRGTSWATVKNVDAEKCASIPLVTTIGGKYHCYKAIDFVPDPNEIGTPLLLIQNNEICAIVINIVRNNIYIWIMFLKPDTRKIRAFIWNDIGDTNLISPISPMSPMSPFGANNEYFAGNEVAARRKKFWRRFLCSSLCK